MSVILNLKSVRLTLTKKKFLWRHQRNKKNILAKTGLNSINPPPPPPPLLWTHLDKSPDTLDGSDTMDNSPAGRPPACSYTNKATLN